MCALSDPRSQYCPRVGESVRVCRPEADCRSEYGCTQPNCPLETSFGFDVFDQRMKAYATAFDLWPLAEGKPRDFPCAQEKLDQSAERS